MDRGEYTLSSILATTPGVQIRNLGGPGQFASMRVRGLRPDATAVLIDGMRFRDSASPQTDSAAFLSNLNFVAMDRVELLRGSGSSLYGTNAAGGVINLVTDPGGGRMHGTVQAEAGNLGLVRGRAQIGGGALNNRLKYSAGIVQLNVTRGVDGNDQTRSTGGQAFLGLDLSPQTTVSGRFYGSDDAVDLNSSPGTRGVPAANIPASGIIDAVPLAADQVERLLNRLPVEYGSATYIPGFDDPDDSSFVPAPCHRRQAAAHPVVLGLFPGQLPEGPHQPRVRERTRWRRRVSASRAELRQLRGEHRHDRHSIERAAPALEPAHRGISNSSARATTICWTTTSRPPASVRAPRSVSDRTPSTCRIN